MKTALDEFCDDKLTEIIDEIYDSGEIPEDLRKSIFKAISKKPGAIDSELHRTSSLMNKEDKLS